MADMDMVFDMSQFNARSAELLVKLQAAKMKALRIIGDELLRRSQEEVPFVSGELMSSGVSQENGDEWIVGYNKVYAAYMHEGHWHDGSHEIQHYSNNRKGRKYLEDPMKINKDIFRTYFGETVKREVGM